MQIPHTYKDKHGTFYVRFVLPITIRHLLPELGRDVRRSLKTKSPKTARIRSRRYLSFWEQVIEQFAMAQYRNREYYLGLITTVDPFGHKIEIDYGSPQQDTDALLSLQKGWAEAGLVSPRQVLIEEFAGQPGRQAALCADELLESPLLQAQSHSVREVVDAFVRAKRNHIDETSLDELRGGLDLFAHFIGDKPFGAISKGDVRRFMNLVPFVPKRFFQNKVLASMDFEDAIKKSKENNLPLPAQKTLRTKIDAVRQLLGWAYSATEFIGEDLSGVMDYKFVDSRNNAKKLGYKAFTREHLENLIGCYVYRGAIPTRVKSIAPHKFWVPMIALFTGARLEEVCQLYVQDVAKAEDVWVFRITHEDLKGEGKAVKLKTRSSDRVVPIHPQLLRMGFLEFYESVKASGAIRIFSELDNDNQKGKYSFTVTKWFGDTLRKEIGYEKNSRYCFHSFRKNVIQELQQIPDIPREIRKAMVGHSRGGGDVHEDYEREYDAAVLDPYLSRLEYKGLKFEGISWADFQRRFETWSSCKSGR